MLISYKINELFTFTSIYFPVLHNCYSKHLPLSNSEISPLHSWQHWLQCQKVKARKDELHQVFNFILLLFTHPFYIFFTSMLLERANYSFSLVLISHLFSKLFDRLYLVKVFSLSHQWPNCPILGVFAVAFLFEPFLAFAGYPILESPHVGLCCSPLTFLCPVTAASSLLRSLPLPTPLTLMKPVVSATTTLCWRLCVFISGHLFYSYWALYLYLLPLAV